MYLVISTEQVQCFSVAIAGESLFRIKTVNEEFKHSELLLPTTIKLMRELEITLKDLLGIAVVSGPGAFSALRCGIATANALAYSLDIPVVGIDLAKNVFSDENAKMKAVWRDSEKKFGKIKKFDFKKIAVPKYGVEPHITIKNVR